MPLELEEEELEEQPEEEATPGQEEGEPAAGAGKEPAVPRTRVPGRLEEETSLQLALHRSLEPCSQAAEQEEAATLRRALALSLLEQPPWEAEGLGGQGAGGGAELVVHVPFEQDLDELHQALEAALESHLQEETVRHRGRALPQGLCTRLEQCHGVSVGLCDNYTVLRGFGAQPARAARHLAALLAGPQDQSWAFPLETSDTACKSMRCTGRVAGAGYGLVPQAWP